MQASDSRTDLAFVSATCPNFYSWICEVCARLAIRVLFWDEAVQCAHGETRSQPRAGCRGLTALEPRADARRDSERRHELQLLLQFFRRGARGAAVGVRRRRRLPRGRTADLHAPPARAGLLLR
eukprot:3345093-Rhodomonas_salina.2